MVVAICCSCNVWFCVMKMVCVYNNITCGHTYILYICVHMCTCSILLTYFFYSTYSSVVFVYM